MGLDSLLFMRGTLNEFSLSLVPVRTDCTILRDKGGWFDMFIIKNGFS